MPELPEVETIKRELAPYVIGRTFTHITIYDDKPIKQLAPDEFCYRLLGQRIHSLERRGKYLIFHLTADAALIIHLRMTGSLILNPGQPDPYARIIFQLDNGNCIVFYDRRRLGVVWLTDNSQFLDQKLGPEPLEQNFTVETLAMLLQRRQAPIKAILLDQTFIAGIGNMYADEALFLAEIHPLRKASSLSKKEIQKLYQAIRRVLHEAIESKGASIDTYRRPEGDKGTAQFHFHVAHKRGESCPKCGTAIERLPVRNRGSYYCPVCQKT